MAELSHWYLHVDLDAFFASVEQLDNPEYRGKPVIVGGKPEDRRSVVSTASYEARAFGVHSAMPTFQAYRLCPQGIFVHGRMHRYAELSHQIMNIFRDYSPDVDQMSIDEAFIDLTGTEKLFGSPEETAKKIKARVKEETGLTVSIGLASTKYLAKIASGLSKPDGFFYIHKGNEENFMLNLPLNKVWGLGPKSLELIRSKGFSTTRDIYEKDYDTLDFLFGKNMAGFLYNVVRGIEKESFSRETKSHSISAETTFPYDLTDIYTIETELLELAQGVFFRLLKEESYSRTAMVKIRYDDFSTSTVQETVERNIITLDSFYEIIKRLFEKRYQNGRGIRLLGVGFENIFKEEKPYQQDLFSINNDEKKQAVEKAILKLSKKHPELKVSKARTLKALLFAFLLLSLTGRMDAQESLEAETAVEAAAVSESADSVQAVESEETAESEEAAEPSKAAERADSEEPPVYLFDYEINDKNHVDFSASGLWKIDFTTGLDISFGNGTSTAASPSLPVFKQETDISTLLTLNRHWYFEAAFADEFTRNTFAFGYNGENLVRSFRLANRGITMSEGYSAEHFGYSLRGGNNQAPGMSLKLVTPSEKLQADFLVRFDMTETKSEIYYGMNKVSDSKIRPEDFALGREFHFPKEAESLLYEIENIFVEDKSGTYSDQRGRSYRKLRRDEYSVARTAGSSSADELRLFIAQEAQSGKTADGTVPSLLITFAFASGPSEIISSAGSWDDKDTFLGKIQEELSYGGKYKLEDYAYSMKTEIDGKNALIIQNYQGFSPFLCPCIYDRSGKEAADYLVIADKSEIPVNHYKATEAQEIYTRLFEDFFDSDQSAVRIINKDSLESVYPFAEDCPEIYLGLAQKTNLAIRSRTYTPVTEIAIPKTAASGTVQVYKNGNLLTGTVFNENTGVIELNQTVSDTDQLLITWQEESSDYTAGAVAGAAGLKINFLPELSGDISITTRQPVNQKEYLIENGKQKNSFTSLSTGLTYENYGLTLTEKTALTLINDNTAEGLQLYSWQEVHEDYLKEKESMPDTKTPAPEKASSVSFSKQDFTPYNIIKTEVEIRNEDAASFTGPLTIIFDEDTGTSEPGNTAITLVIKRLPPVKGKKSLHELELTTDGQTVIFDGQTLSDEDYTIKIDREIVPSRLIVKTDKADKKILIEKLSFNEAQNYGTVRNYAFAGYKKDGSLISINDFILLKDLFVNAQSDQSSGNLTKPEPSVNAKSQAGFTLSGIKLSADVAFQNLLESSELYEAGHSVKTDDSYFAFKIFSAEDTYRYKPSSNELKKENLLRLSFSPLKAPLQLMLKTNASDSPYNQKQNAQLSAEYRQKIFTGEAGLKGGLTLSQKNQIDLTEELNDEAFSSYTDGWLKISEEEFSNGKEEADSRDSKLSLSLNGIIPFKEDSVFMKPKLSWELADEYKVNQIDFSDTALFADKEFLQLQLPFTINKKSFSFDISRTGGAKDNIRAGGNYKEDISRLFDLQRDRDWFYTSIPFYELFEKNLNEKISQSAAYAAKYEGNFRRSLYNSKLDIIVPSALTLSLSREINRQPPEADLYQIKCILTNNSVNNFGSQSAGKHFSWFTQEELTTSLTAKMKIPAEDIENYKLYIQTYAQLLLFLTEKSILTEQINFEIENTADWNIKNTISYSRPSQTSLITGLALLLIPDSEKKDFTITRNDSFTAEAGKVETELRQKYSYNHTVGIDFLEYYNVNAGLGGSLTLNQNTADKINITLTLGAKAEF